MNFEGPKYYFPHPDQANDEGFLAVSKELNCEIVLSAYYNGIFPWEKYEEYFTWWSPNPRMVLFPSEIYISKSMRKLIRDEKFRYTFDKAFDEVIESCSSIPRSEQLGTWIIDDFKKIYKELHKRGHAHSLEVWKDDELVGGLYGITIGHIFTGESMFSKEANASKFALIKLAKFLQNREGAIIDCQSYTDHLASMGARQIDRNDFLDIITKEREKPELTFPDI